MAINEITKRCPDFEFDLITNRFDPKLPAKEKIGNVDVYRIGKGRWWEKYFYPWLAQKKARELVAAAARWSPDQRAVSVGEDTNRQQLYCIVWGVLETWAGLAALKFKEKNPEVKYLLTMQSGDSDEFIKRRTWFWSRRYEQIFRKADFIQVISEFLKKRARRYGYKGEIEVVPNGVDIEKFKAGKPPLAPPYPKGENPIEKLLKGGSEKVIITVSRIEEKNGVEYLIKAVQNLPVKLLIVGGGKLESSLKALVAKLDIKDKVIFTGRINHDDLPKYYSVADIFVRPSLSEGLGNVFLEAMALGVPVVGTAVGGIPDFLKDGETGLFCKTKDPSDLAEKIKLLLEDEKLREKLIRNGKELVQKKYNWDKIAEKMNDIFKELIK